jgi:hypothetical protein
MTGAITTVTEAELADLLGVTRQAINKAVQRGRLTREEDGRLDPIRARRDWEQNRRRRRKNAGPSPVADFPLLPAVAPPAAPSPPAGAGEVGEHTAAEAMLDAGQIPTIAQSQAVREAYKTRAEKLKFEREAGRLIERTQVVATWHRVVRTTRDRLLLLPERMAPVLAAETDPVVVRRLIEAELRAALEEITEERTAGG